MESPEISIIANFYNSEKYIPTLVKSVLAQTFRNWELIAVNDCSPGNDLRVLRKFEAMPAMQGRMRIIDNKVNQGISFAKNTGIKAAKGKYITFIDGDDWLEPMALEKMYEAAETNDVDLVVCDFYRTFRNLKKTLCKSDYIEYGKVYDRAGIKENVLRGFFGINIYSNVGYWGKLFRRENIDKSEYKPTKVVASEDLFFNLEYLLVTERMMFLSYPVYNWRWGGISSGSTNKSEISFSSIGTLRNFNDFYFRRLKIIEAYDFPQGLTPLRIELYNVLRCHLDSVCAPDPASEAGGVARKTMGEVIALPAYRELLKLRGNPYIRDPKFIDAIETNDVDWLYDFFHQIYRKGWKRRLARRILSKFC